MTMTKTHMAGVLLAAISMSGALTAAAQSLYPDQLREIESNNPLLHARYAASEATARDALTGLGLPDPEVGVSYLFGAPRDVPNETDLEVSQGFDFATMSGAKKRVAEAEGKVARATFATSRAEIMLQAEKALIGYAFQLALIKEMETRHSRIGAMLKAAEELLASNTISRLEYNKIELEHFAATNELDMARIDLEATRRELESLNGGRALSMPSEWPVASLPSDFDAWIAESSSRSAELQVLRAQLDKSVQDVNLRKKEGLPGFSIGYAAQLVKESNYHGPSLSVSVPLWGNRGRVSAAKAIQVASELELQAAEDQYRLMKSTQYERARRLHKAYTDMEALYAHIAESNEVYLKKALDSGKITVLEYMTEREDFYAHAVKFLETRRDYLLARAELYAETL